MIDRAELIKNAVQPRTFWADELPDHTLKFLKEGWSKGIKCPFTEHSNDHKRGGFSVSVKGGFFCHKCNARGGDIISFISQLNGLNFLDSVALIANDYGVEIPNERYKPQKIEAGNDISSGKTKEINDLFIHIKCGDLSVVSKLIKLLKSVYGTGFGKHYSPKYFLDSIKKLSLKYKKCAHKHHVGFNGEEAQFYKAPSFIFSDYEIKLGKYVIYCLERIA